MIENSYNFDKRFIGFLIAADFIILNIHTLWFPERQITYRHSSVNVCFCSIGADHTGGGAPGDVTRRGLQTPYVIPRIDISFVLGST